MNADQIEEMEVLKLLVDFDHEHPGLLRDFLAALKNDPEKVIEDIREAANMMELD
jgi:hypothetical protein